MIKRAYLRLEFASRQHPSPYRLSRDQLFGRNKGSNDSTDTTLHYGRDSSDFFFCFYALKNPQNYAISRQLERSKRPTLQL